MINGIVAFGVFTLGLMLFACSSKPVTAPLRPIAYIGAEQN
jgi:hypothetical protein